MFLGGKMFNLRAGSNNFSDEELESVYNMLMRREKESM